MATNLMVPPEHTKAPRLPNVGSLERMASMAAGGALVFAGLRRGALSGIPAALLGAALVYRGVRGYCPGYALLDVDRAGYANPAVGVRAAHGAKCVTSALCSSSASHSKGSAPTTIWTCSSVSGR